MELSEFDQAALRDATPEQLRGAALFWALTHLAEACSQLHADPGGDESEAINRLADHYYDQFHYGQPMSTVLQAAEQIKAELGQCWPKLKV